MHAKIYTLIEIYISINAVTSWQQLITFGKYDVIVH